MRFRIDTPDNAEKIQWEKNFVLKPEHFKNENNFDYGKLGVSILPEFKIVLIDKQFTDYDITNIQIRSMFRPADVKKDRDVWPENEDENVLLFYKGAFDLVEQIARKTQTELEEKIFRKIFPCKGRGKSERGKFSQTDTEKQITV